MDHGPVRVGVVGLGRSGWGIHCTTIPSMPDKFQVVAVFDPLEPRATDAAAKLGVKQYASFEALLADREIELVVVASPNGFHASQARAALEAGKHVICEKPFGLTAADADAIIAASKKSGKVVQPFQQRRYEADFQKVKEICASGQLGRIEFIRISWAGFKRRWDWQTLKSMNGGAMNNNGPHLIDHALELFGDGDPEVWADMRRGLCSGDAEDHLQIVLRGKDRPTVEILLSDLFAFGQDRWLVSGSSGGLRGNGDKLEWKWVDWTSMPPRPIDPNPTPDRSYNSEKLEWKSDTWVAGSTDAGAGAAPASGPVVALYEDLWKTIRLGTPQVITPEQVRRRVRVMEEARRVAGFW